MSCKISTIDKKSIITTEEYTNGDYSAFFETVWRWGYVVVEENADDIDVSGDDLLVTDYSIIDQDFSDGCSFFWRFSDNVPEEVREQVEQFLEEHDYSELEELGWNQGDTEVFFVGDLEIEQLDDEEEVEEEVDPSKPTWPFS